MSVSEYSANARLNRCSPLNGETAGNAGSKFGERNINVPGRKTNSIYKYNRNEGSGDGAKPGGEGSSRNRTGNRGAGSGRGRKPSSGVWRRSETELVKDGKSEEKPASPTCICQRPRMHVKCMSCQMFIDGVRVQKICPDHPNVTFLMDLKMCFNKACRADASFLVESPMDDDDDDE